MSSSLISLLARHCEDDAAFRPCVEGHKVVSLSAVLAAVPDPRRVRGRRYRIGALLALCLVAVLGGARSLAQITRYAAEAGDGVRAELGFQHATPNASTLGRLLARLDGDALDDTVGAWLARHAADPVEDGHALVGLAVDGKSVRGSRTDDGTVRLLATALHESQTVIAQRQIAAKSNEPEIVTSLTCGKVGESDIASGAGVIKAMVTGVGLTKDGPKSHQSQFTAEELAALVEEAHKAGVPVAAHAHGADGIAAAVEAGVDTIEHCTWMSSDGLDFRPDVVQQIITKGITVCPAVSPHWQMLPKFFGEERARAMFDLVRQMADAGVCLIAGTDAGVQRAGFDGLAQALSFYSHLGLPNTTIIDMATSQAAAALGLGDITGKVAPGYRADLLLVHGDPLGDLSALSGVRAVFASGLRHEPNGTGQ